MQAIPTSTPGPILTCSGDPFEREAEKERERKREKERERERKREKERERIDCRKTGDMFRNVWGPKER